MWDFLLPRQRKYLVICKSPHNDKMRLKNNGENSKNYKPCRFMFFSNLQSTQSIIFTLFIENLLYFKIFLKSFLMG